MTDEAQRAIWRKANAKYRQTAKGKAAAIRNTQEARARDPHKNEARRQVDVALRYGRLVKPELCSSPQDCFGRLNAHHADYTKPLEVTWLCEKHHKELHNAK